LDGEGLGGRAIDLHPGISVVTDLDGDLEARLLRACQALPAADDPGCDGLIEAHGVLFDLGPESLALLGLDDSMDVVMAPDESESETDDRPSAIEVLDASVAELRALRAELDRAQLEVLAELESSRGDLDPFARTAYEEAHNAADRDAGLSDVEQMLDDLEDVEPLRDRLAEIERIDREIHEIDREAIAAALEVAVDDNGVDLEATEAGRLAVELRQIDTELADLDSALESKGMHPLELARQRDALSVEVARLESEHAPREVDPADREAIEAAQDEVVAAQRKLTGSLLGGRNAERQLEEAIEAQQELLDRIGQPTYSAFVMAVTVGGVDPALEVRLHEARKRLTDCQRDYEAAAEQLEHDPTRTALSLRHEEIVARATTLLDRDPGPDVVGELLSFKEKRDEASPVDVLRHLLEREGLVEPGLGLDDGEVCDFAAAWLDEVANASRESDERADEAADLRERISTVEKARAEADELRARADEMAPSDELVEARERLERHDQATAKVADLTEMLKDVDGRRHEIEAGLDAQEAIVALARSGVTDADARDEIDEREAAEELRSLLNCRLQAHRGRSFAGAVPLVIRDVFGGFGRDLVGELLSELAERADDVQVIILDDGLPVVTWATSIGFETAAVVAPE
jgi:hypothetical protein